MNSLPFSFQLFSSALGGSATPRGRSSNGIVFLSSSEVGISTVELSSVEEAVALDPGVGMEGDVAPGLGEDFGWVELWRTE